MIPARFTRTATAVLILIALSPAAAGCGRGTPPSAPSASSVPSALPDSTPTPPDRTLWTPGTAPVAATSGHSGPAVRAAVRFERAHCAWDWREPRRVYVAAQQKLATPRYAAALRAASDPTSWRDGVVAQQQTVTCTVADAARAVDAPSSLGTVYVRMRVDTEITSTLGTFAAGPRIESWLVARVSNRWLVAGTFAGG